MNTSNPICQHMDLTALLQASSRQSVAAKGENPTSLGDLFPLVYRELKVIAHRQLGCFPKQSLDTTSLVHEAYLKMIDQDRSTVHDKSHFFLISAMAMRQVLVAAARRRARLKRGRGAKAETLTEVEDQQKTNLDDLLSVHHALERLEQIDERLGRTVECRFFAGMTEEETALALGVSVATVQRDWRRAKAWLRRYLRQASPTTP